MHIKDGNDRAKEMGVSTYRELINLFTDLRRAEQMKRRLFKPSGSKAREKQIREAMQIPGWTGNIRSDAKPAKAAVDGGRWLAQCECGNYEVVTPTDPIMFCHQCGNKDFGHDARPVEFR
jgi:hypothetical protein